MVYLSEELLAVIGMQVFLVPCSFSTFRAFPVLLQTASSEGLLQFAVLKPVPDPSDSVVPSSSQEALGSFLCRYLKKS